MNYACYYLQRNKKRCAASVFELLRTGDVPANGDYTRSLNAFSQAYRRRLIGFDKRDNHIAKILKKLLPDVHPFAVALIHQRVLDVYMHLIDNELYEMMESFFIMNQRLAKQVKNIRPDMDVEPLLSESKLKIFENKLNQLQF